MSDKRHNDTDTDDESDTHTGDDGTRDGDRDMDRAGSGSESEPASASESGPGIREGTDIMTVGLGVTVAVFGYGVVALATGIERSATLSTVMRPGAVGLYPGAVLAGWLDGGSLRRAADTGFRVVFVATAVAQGALFLQVDAPAPPAFRLLGLMGVSLAYALPAVLGGALGAALRHRWDRHPEVPIDV